MLWIWLIGALLAAMLLAMWQVRFARSLGTIVVRDGIAYAERTALSPVVVGVLRPSIVVPGDFDSRYTADERALILAHERTHIRRGDLIANALCSLITCLLWFNPLIHLAAGRFRFDQELACDAKTLRGRSRARQTYASAILKTVSLDLHVPVGSPWQDASPLLQRLQHLRQPTVPPRRRILGSVLVGLLLATATGGAWALRPLELYRSGISTAGARLAPTVPTPDVACPLATRQASIGASSRHRAHELVIPWEVECVLPENNMLVAKYISMGTLVGCALLLPTPFASAAPPTATTATQMRGSPDEGQHDFDFELGSWKIHLKKLLHPLTGSNAWVEFEGTSVTRKLWDGRSQIEQFETDGAAGRIEGMTLRLFNPQSHQWRLYWANSKVGVLDPPQIGQFTNGIGEFYAQDTVDGKVILVRFLWSKTTSDSPHFEQSYSADGGKTWEVNWITDQTRVAEVPDHAR